MKDLNTFDLNAWSTPHNETGTQPQYTHSAQDTEQQVRQLADIVISRGIDITQGYAAWRNLAFALADGLGENGRSLFHDLSRMNGSYNPRETDKQYSACLRSHGQGITIKTFFQMVKEGGVDIREVAHESEAQQRSCAPCADAQLCAAKEENANYLIINDGLKNSQPCAAAQVAHGAHEAEKQLDDELSFNQTFSDKIPLEDWCDYFKPVLASMDDAESRDKMILGTLVINSGMLPNCYGIYGGHTVYAPLYILFYGPSASRKGEIGSCQFIARPLKNEIVGQYQRDLDNYKHEHSQWEAQGSKSERGEEPQEPEYRSPIIPANSSASAAYLALKANGGWAIMFETEAATLTQSLLSDYGDYTAGLLAAFHHEPIKLNRVKDKVRLDIDEPRLAIGLTCTAGQLPKLFPSFENGLGNRFLYYGLNRKLNWNNPFKKIEKPLDEVYEDLGKESLELYHLLKGMEKRRIQFMLEDDQIEQFNSTFSELLKEQFSMLGDGISSFIFRLGLSTFRIAMVLTLLRCYCNRDKTKPLFKDNEQAIICKQKDFNIAMTIMNTLVNHTATIYAALAKDDEKLIGGKLTELTAVERRLYMALGTEFTTDNVKEVATDLNINYDTARRYLGKFVNTYHIAERIKIGLYRKQSK